MSAPTVQVEHGFVIVKPDGRVWDEYLYPRRESAERIARCRAQGFAVYPARRVFSLRQTSGTTAVVRKELIIDRGEA